MRIDMRLKPAQIGATAFLFGFKAIFPKIVPTQKFTIKQLIYFEMFWTWCTVLQFLTTHWQTSSSVISYRLRSLWKATPSSKLRSMHTCIALHKIHQLSLLHSVYKSDLYAQSKLHLNSYAHKYTKHGEKEIFNVQYGKKKIEIKVIYKKSYSNCIRLLRQYLN